jgi:5'(3')-deoxyribonucleotidase
MKKKSIAVDLDDVLASTAEALIIFSNANYGTNFKIDDYDDEWARLWNIEQEEVERRSIEFHIPQNLAAFEVKVKAKSAIQKLSTKYDLYIVTARSYRLKDSTKEWVERHFKNAFLDIHFVPLWEPSNKVTKTDICKQIGATYLIDDLPQHCNMAAENGITAILFGNYGWNHCRKVANNVIRCADWPAVLSYFGEN